MLFSKTGCRFITSDSGKGGSQFFKGVAKKLANICFFYIWSNVYGMIRALTNQYD